MTISAPYTFIVGREMGEIITDDPYPGRERHRPKLVHPRGRWRRRKRVVRQLAVDLGYPGCLKVASQWEIEGHVTAAGVRLRDFHKLHRERMSPAEGQAYRARSRDHRRAINHAVKSGAIRTGAIPL